MSKLKVINLLTIGLTSSRGSNTSNTCTAQTQGVHTELWSTSLELLIRRGTMSTRRTEEQEVAPVNEVTQISRNQVVDFAHKIVCFRAPVRMRLPIPTLLLLPILSAGLAARLRAACSARGARGRRACAERAVLVGLTAAAADRCGIGRCCARSRGGRGNNGSAICRCVGNLSLHTHTQRMVKDELRNDAFAADEGTGLWEKRKLSTMMRVGVWTDVDEDIVLHRDGTCSRNCWRDELKSMQQRTHQSWVQGRAS